jgi:membrane-bound serine protease (ClpP class)
MNTIFLLFLVGFILLAFEVIVPGAILGTIGGLCLLGGITLAFMEYGPIGGSSAIAAALVMTGLMIYIEFRLLPKTRWGKQMFLDAAINGTSQPLPAEESAVVGRPGKTLTPLSPSGYVLIDGHRYEAFSRSGLLAQGEPVQVVGLDAFRLIVSKPSSL